MNTCIRKVGKASIQTLGPVKLPILTSCHVIYVCIVMINTKSRLLNVNALGMGSSPHVYSEENRMIGAEISQLPSLKLILHLLVHQYCGHSIILPTTYGCKCTREYLL